MIMRHLRSLSLLLLSGLILWGCNNETGNHYVQFVYPNSQSDPYFLGYKRVYADQFVDSIVFATTEPWKLTLDYSDSDKDWCTMDGELMQPDFKMEKGAIYYVSGPVRFTSNTTGRKRTVRVDLGAGEFTCSGGFIQLPYLNVTRPLRYVVSDDTHTVLTSRDSLSSLVVLANAPTDSIVFTVQADWKLQGTRNSWIKPAVAQGHSGRQCINLAIEPNLTHSARYDTLFLSTMGVNSSTGKFIVDTIPFVQHAAQ